MELLKADKIDQKEAGRRLSISVRQIKRIVRRYRNEGLPGLISKKRGRSSNRRLDDEMKRLSIELIGAHYYDFGPTLVCEKLGERHGIHFCIESTRQIMMAAGYWQPRKGAKVCVHPMRERRARFGELIQIDGSPHDWFEGRAESCTLLVFIDDATSKLTQLRFMPTETTLGYMHVSRMITSRSTAYRWRCIATDTASSASIPEMLTPRQKPSLAGRHVN